MQHKLSQQIIVENLEKFPEDINITRIARILGRNVSTIWFKIAGKRKWDVESWLMVLSALGKMQYQDNKIIIHCNMSENWEQKFNDSFRQYFAARKQKSSDNHQGQSSEASPHRDRKYV